MRIKARVGVACGVQRVDKAPEQLEQMDVADRVALNRPLVAAEALLDEREHFTPALIAGAARGMDHRGDKRHPRDDPRLAFEIAVFRQQGLPPGSAAPHENDIRGLLCNFGRKVGPSLRPSSRRAYVSLQGILERVEMIDALLSAGWKLRELFAIRSQQPVGIT
jgi:hypothetical protein